MPPPKTAPKHPPPPERRARLNNLQAKAMSTMTTLRDTHRRLLNKLAMTQPGERHIIINEEIRDVGLQLIEMEDEIDMRKEKIAEIAAAEREA